MLRSLERLGPDTRAWEALPPMGEGRYGGCSAVVGGDCYICGGVNDENRVLRSVERLDPDTRA